jgi:hypothetical protein
MKKFSIIINHIGNDLYALVLKKYELNENNEEINVENLIQSNKTLEECILLQSNFIENGSNN